MDAQVIALIEGWNDYPRFHSPSQANAAVMGLNSLRGSREIDVLEVKNKQREWNHVFMAANRYTARDENGKHQTRNKSIVKSILSGNVNTTPSELLAFYSTLIRSVCQFHRIRDEAINKSEFNDENVEQAKSGHFTCCTDCLLIVQCCVSPLWHVYSSIGSCLQKM